MYDALAQVVWNQKLDAERHFDSRSDGVGKFFMVACFITLVKLSIPWHTLSIFRECCFKVYCIHEALYLYLYITMTL